MILRYPTGDELGGPIKPRYELSKEQIAAALRCHEEWWDSFDIPPDQLILNVARAIAEPLAAEIATLETLNESAKGQIKAQVERIAEVEAMRDVWFSRHEALKLANECCEKRIAELEAGSPSLSPADVERRDK